MCVKIRYERGVTEAELMALLELIDFDDNLLDENDTDPIDAAVEIEEEDIIATQELEEQQYENEAAEIEDVLLTICYKIPYNTRISQVKRNIQKVSAEPNSSNIINFVLIDNN